MCYSFPVHNWSVPCVLKIHMFPSALTGLYIEPHRLVLYFTLLTYPGRKYPKTLSDTIDDNVKVMTLPSYGIITYDEGLPLCILCKSIDVT